MTFDDSSHGSECAKWFKYYLQFNNPKIAYPIAVDRIGYKGLYLKYRKIFDLLSQVFEKHKLDIGKYIKFCVIDLKYSEYHIKKLVEKSTIDEYADFIQKKRKFTKIYQLFIASAQNIAKECVDKNYFTTRDFLKYLIESNKLGNYYLAGVISKYYLAAIPKFNKIIPQLDYFSKCELSRFEKLYDVYNSDVNQAFLYSTNNLINPIEFTDKLICGMRNKK